MGRREPGKREEQGGIRQGGKRPPDKRIPEKMHPAGPHARPELTNNDATPGTGALPDMPNDGDVDPGSE